MEKLEKETKKNKYDDWEIKNAVRVLIEAEEIKKNTELMALVAPELKKEFNAIKSAAEILYDENMENK